MGRAGRAEHLAMVRMQVGLDILQMVVQTMVVVEGVVAIAQ